MPLVSPPPASPERKRPPRSGASDQRKGEAGQRATGLAPPAYLHPWPPLPSICWCQAARPLLGHGLCQNAHVRSGISSSRRVANTLLINELQDRNRSSKGRAEASFDVVSTAGEPPGRPGGVTSVMDVKCETVEVSTLCRNFAGLFGSRGSAGGSEAAPVSRCRTSSSSRGGRSWTSPGVPRPAACSTRSG